MEMSYCQELDIQGMQPHSREFLEYQVLRERSEAKAMRMPDVRGSERMYDNQVHQDGFAGWRDRRPVSEEGEQFTAKP